MPRQSRHVEPLPPHTSHTSYLFEPAGTPLQSKHVEPSPPHRPQASVLRHGNGTRTKSSPDGKKSSPTPLSWNEPINASALKNHSLLAERGASGQPPFC